MKERQKTDAVTVTDADRIKELQAKAVQGCAKELDEVLTKHGCQLAGVPGLVPDGTGGWKIQVRLEVQLK